MVDVGHLAISLAPCVHLNFDSLLGPALLAGTVLPLQNATNEQNLRSRPQREGSEKSVYQPERGGKSVQEPQHEMGDSNPESPQLVFSGTGARSLQACNSCRRRKTKCSGQRPTCLTCASRQLSCTWPSIPETDATYLHIPKENAFMDSGTPPKRRRIYRARSIEGGDHPSSDRPSLLLLGLAMNIFRDRHFSVEFCSFLHMPSVDLNVLRRRSPFFAHALIALSALYMSEEEAAEAGFETPQELSEWHTTVARECARQSVDAPSISSIQANLILALRELLSRTLYKAWIFTGIAIRQAQALRLGVEYHSNLPNRQREVQRRTYWSAFIMDRMVSHCCWRPEMIDSDCARLNLPCPETTFLLQESFDARNLETLTFPCEVSDLGLPPYFIAVLHLWSQATYTLVKGGRRYARFSPDDPQGFFRQHERKVDDIRDSLSATTRWSKYNAGIFRHMRQGALFVNFHFLLHHARCVMHQEYLPYRDSACSTSSHDALQKCHDEDGTCTHCQTERIISRCLSSSEAIFEVMSDLLLIEDGQGKQDLQSVFAAGAILSAANIQLWLHYVHGRDEEMRRSALARVEKAAAVFESWKPQWPVAEAWLSTLESLRRLYQATYAPDPSLEERPDESHGAVAKGSALSTAIANEVYERPSPRLIEGNGLPDLNEQMSDKIRFILLASLEDTGARERVLSSSMKDRSENSTNHDDLMENMEFDIQALYTDEMWSGFHTDAIDGVAEFIELEHEVSVDWDQGDT